MMRGQRVVVIPLALLVVALGCTACGGGAFLMGSFALMSTEVPENIDPSEGIRVEGETVRWVVYGQPASSKEWDLEKAIRRALEDAPGKNMLVKAQVRSYVRGFPPFYFARGLRVSGTAVKYVPRVEEAPGDG